MGEFCGDGGEGGGAWVGGFGVGSRGLVEEEVVKGSLLGRSRMMGLSVGVVGMRMLVVFVQN